jgi:hypothetical protein
LRAGGSRLGQFDANQPKSTLPGSNTEQIPTDTDRKMNRIDKLTVILAAENGISTPANMGQNSYCQFGFFCYSLRSLPSNGGRGKRFIFASSGCGLLRLLVSSKLDEDGSARRRTTTISNYNPVFRGMLCGKIPRGFNQRKNCD